MSLQHVGYVELPEHAKPGGFDHAAVHRASGRVYVAHTANDAVDVIDASTRRYLGSIGGLATVAGALVSEERGLVFTSNRGENTVGIFTAGESDVVRVPVGVKPNGLAYDSGRDLLLAANVGDPAVPGSCSVTMVDVTKRVVVADIAVAGRTRWTVFDAVADAFYVNVADPPEIVVIDAAGLCVSRVLKVPAAGPHGLDLATARRRLFCACDGGALIAFDVESSDVAGTAPLGGVPDVVFFNERRRRVYVAIGDPGVIEVFDADTLRQVETVRTERGAHTLAFDSDHDTIHAFLPETHRAVVYVDRD